MHTLAARASWEEGENAISWTACKGKRRREGKILVRVIYDEDHGDGVERTILLSARLAVISSILHQTSSTASSLE